MKRFITIVLTAFFICSLFVVHTSAAEYVFYPENSEKEIASDELDKLFEALPEGIRDKLSEVTEGNAEEITEKYTFEFFAEIFKENLLSALPDYLNMLSVSMAAIIIICISKQMHNTISSTELSPALNMCTGLSSALIIGNMQRTVLDGVNRFLTLLADTMLLIVPVMEAIYISGGNFTLASVTATGLNLMIAFTQNLFSNFLSPAISISFLLATVAAVTGNKGIIFMSKTLRAIVTTVIVFAMTFLSFALNLQSTASYAVDNFAIKTIRFALGSYIPIVGGTISESFSLIKSSVSLIKNLSGVTAIVILILICAGPLLSLLMARFTVYISSNLSAILGCDSEQELYSEIGSSYTLLIAVVLSSVLMYILALAQFCKTAISVS